MFTGIITHLGKVTSSRKKKGIEELTIKSDLPLKKIKTGSSVAVDGACFTIFKKKGHTFSIQIMEETLNRTTSSNYSKNSIVNLELPLKLGDRLDGHFTLGHIDSKETVLSTHKRKGSTTLKISVNPNNRKYFALKGSVAINGVSLTITAVNQNSVSVDLIPHTLENTNLKLLKKGSEVNIEIDTLARYIETLIKK